MDNKTKQQRSLNMSAVRTKGTKPEILVRKQLFKQGFRYRLNVKTILGSPDVVLSKYRTLIFINGCFWHGHTNCKKAQLPSTNVEFWRNKIECTKRRDKSIIKQLEQLGWHIIVCWECDILYKELFFKINDNHIQLQIK
jgi:DNA mismatch endonuclease (patch repair protein)